MNLLEAKRLEYFIRSFKKQLESIKNAKDNYLPTYKILWESNNKLFFCNTYLSRLLINCNEKYSASSSKDLYFLDNFDIKIKDLICDLSFPDPKTKKVNIDPMRLYKDPLLFFDHFDCFIRKLPEFSDALDQTTIFNVQSFNSGHSQKLDFLKVGENFELNPVSLIENVDKE